MKTYTVICPDPECSEEWEHEFDPEAIDKPGGDALITCQTCLEEWEWEYDAETDTLVLLEDEFEEDELEEEDAVADEEDAEDDE